MIFVKGANERNEFFEKNKQTVMYDEQVRTNKANDKLSRWGTDLGMNSVSIRHNSADSVPTSNLVCITEVAIRSTLCIAGII